MSGFRYAQLCPIARATEVVGERWTLLILRELFQGPMRFSDLRRRLRELSPSVLADRLSRLESRGIVVRRELPPPAARTVYQLGDAGRALGPVMIELARWGARFLLPTVPGDQVEPEWCTMALRVFARRDPTPARAFNVRVAKDDRELACHVAGGPGGTRVRDGQGPADATLRAAPDVVLELLLRALEPGAAERSGRLSIEGDARAVAAFPELFELDSANPRSGAPGPGSTR